ncbi:MAG: cupin domain-containing protein [Alphaproteobacteria bacterium]|nr:cupin domain-containing protein [Alphaproteobacteria bacterium]
MADAFDLMSTYAQLRDDGSALVTEGGNAFWSSLASRPELHGGRLLGATAQTQDWPHWEMHPAGDEILILMSGAFGLQIEHVDGRVETIEMRAGSTCVVPKGLWHRGLARAPGELVFITPGAGTQHRAVG